MGTPPEITRLRRRNDELFTEMVALNFALGKVTGQFPPFNEQQHKIADDRLAKRKAEWEARGNASPEEIQNGSLHI